MKTDEKKRGLASGVGSDKMKRKRATENRRFDDHREGEGHTWFSSSPPSSVTRPEKGYSLGIAGLSGTRAYLATKPKETKLATAIENQRRATFGWSGAASGPHMPRISSFSWY